jgi:drug/metabolite transporter (DMT)-like permease
MQRPTSIIWFERIMFGTLALGAIQGLLLWPSIASVAGPAFLLTVEAGVLAFFAALTLFVSRRRSKVAKWILIALAVVGVAITVMHYLQGRYLGVPLIGLIQSVGQLLAYGLLFTDQSRQWLRGEEPTSLNSAFK